MTLEDEIADDDLARRQRDRVFYTWSAQNQVTPLEIVSGAGARFVTADGARWHDLGSMTWNAALGHGHPRMKAAMTAAAARGLLVYPSSVFPDKVRAGELLAEVAPRGLTRSFLCLSGAEANENAIKIARLVTGRKKVVAPYAQLPRRDIGHAVSVGRSARRALRARPPGRAPHRRSRTAIDARSAATRAPATTSAPTIWTRSSRARGQTPSPP